MLDTGKGICRDSTWSSCGSGVSKTPCSDFFCDLMWTCIVHYKGNFLAVCRWRMSYWYGFIAQFTILPFHQEYADSGIGPMLSASPL